MIDEALCKFPTALSVLRKEGEGGDSAASPSPPPCAALWYPAVAPSPSPQPCSSPGLQVGRKQEALN